MSRDACSQLMQLLWRAVLITVFTVGFMSWSTMSALPLLAAEPPETLLDCTVSEVLQEDLTLSLQVASFSFVSAQDLSGVEEERAAWSDITQGILTRYVELCHRYNRGDVDQGEYRRRLHDLQGYYRVAKDFEARLLENRGTRTRESIGGTKHAQFRSLDSSGQPTRASFIAPLRALAKEIDALGPMGRSLQPSR